MRTFICLLRGINVGGRRSVRMEDLRAVFEKSGFKKVRTYIQSGNVAFSAPNPSAKALGSRIEKELLGAFGFPIPVMIRGVEELTRVIQRNPFFREPGMDVGRLHIGFLSQPPGKELVKTLMGMDASPNRFQCLGTEIHLHCPNGLGRAKLPDFEKILSTDVTVRNWKTVCALCEME